jgi:PKHD-type hydroxylase
MLIQIADVLSPAEIAEARRQAAGLTFVDGRVTAGWAARLVKDNEQASCTDLAAETLKTWLAERIRAHAVFKLAARPKALSPLLISRYGPGHSYGSHVDDALMGGMRSDVSFTLFLADPADYDGGELVLESAAGEEDYKLAAGCLIAYPSTQLHHVAPVTKGTRLAAVGWARSFIRDAAQRELLFDLDTARRRLFDQHGKTPEFDLISKCSANLLRAWAED